MGEPDDRWYFTKDRLSESPSRRHGYDGDKELSCRQQAANFIQDMGQKLQVTQLCINTAIVYMHRFYVFHSLVQFHRNAIATAALFLAAKVEEQPRKVEHVLKVAHLCLHRETPTSLDTKSELYQEQSNDLVVNESILLQTLGFDVAIDHPHTHVVRCCQLVKASKDLAQTSYFMASNSLHLTTMCLQYKPTVVACFCIHLACKWSNWEIPRSSEGKDWFWYVNQSVTLDLLEQLTSEFLLIFDKCPTKLKKKMMSMNQNNPPVNFGHSSGTHESYHFDEPRKLMGAEANRPPEGFLQLQKSVEKSSSGNSSNTAGSSNSNSTSQQQGQHPHPPRHIDYKEYKEKKERERHDRERAERDRIHRENYLGNQGAHMTSTHGVAKSSDKIKQQQPQRPTSGVPPHKIYPQQRPHPSITTAPSMKEGQPHQQRPPGKDSGKRKYDEMENSGQPADQQFSQDPNHKNYPRNQEEFRHKPSSHYPTGSSTFPNQNADSHPQTKDLTTSGIRDIITQSFGPRDKPHRTAEERAYQNYPYQRPGADKYSSSTRPPHQSVILKTQREEGKKPEEIVKPPSDDSGASNNDWHGKPGNNASGHQHSTHGAERYSVPGKAQVSTQQQKPRDPKLKGHHHMPSKESSQKHPLNLMQGSAPHGSVHGHKKPSEKVIDKNRKYHEQPNDMERGLPASMETLLPSDDVQRPKVSDQKRPYPPDMQRKERPATSSKFPSKVKLAPVPMGSFKPQELPQQGLFDISHSSDMDLPQLMDKVERPAKVPRLDERKKLFEPEQHKPVMGLIGDHLGKPAKTSSIFSPDNNVSPKNIISSLDKEIRKTDLHFSGPSSKKPTSSLFSPPSMPAPLSHRSGSSSSERELVIPSTVPTPVLKTEREKRPSDQDCLLPSLDERPYDHKPYKEKHFRPESNTGSVGMIAAGSAPTVAAVPSRPATTSRHSGINEAGAIIYPPAENQKISHSFPANSSCLPTLPSKQKTASSPVSTVNLSGMDKLVDTSISPNIAAVIKPLPSARPELVQPQKVVVPPKEPEKKVEEKVNPPTVEEIETQRRAEKKKNKDKDRDSHRHKEKKEKRSEGKKEKKKHKDKDKERKKDSHRDKEKHRDRPKEGQEGVPSAESHLKITIPKDKINLTSTEGTGLKIKIAKDRLKPETIDAPKQEGSLKIKIKKDSISNFKEESKPYTKKKEGSSHSFHHKSMKVPPTDGAAASISRNSKKSDGGGR